MTPITPERRDELRQQAIKFVEASDVAGLRSFERPAAIQDLARAALNFPPGIDIAHLPEDYMRDEYLAVIRCMRDHLLGSAE